MVQQQLDVCSRGACPACPGSGSAFTSPGGRLNDGKRGKREEWPCQMAWLTFGTDASQHYRDLATEEVFLAAGVEVNGGMVITIPLR